MYKNKLVNLNQVQQLAFTERNELVISFQTSNLTLAYNQIGEASRAFNNIVDSIYEGRSLVDITPSSLIDELP